MGPGSTKAPRWVPRAKPCGRVQGETRSGGFHREGRNALPWPGDATGVGDAPCQAARCYRAWLAARDKAYTSLAEVRQKSVNGGLLGPCYCDLFADFFPSYAGMWYADYMQFSDGDNGSGVTPDAPFSDAADFGRHRVSRILKRERPRHEQKDQNAKVAGDLVWQSMKADPHGVPAWKFGAHLDALVACRWRTTMVWASRNLGACYRSKKNAANLNSRFMGRPER